MYKDYITIISLGSIYITKVRLSVAKQIIETNNKIIGA